MGQSPIPTPFLCQNQGLRTNAIMDKIKAENGLLYVLQRSKRFNFPKSALLQDSIHTIPFSMKFR